MRQGGYRTYECGRDSPERSSREFRLTSLDSGESGIGADDLVEPGKDESASDDLELLGGLNEETSEGYRSERSAIGQETMGVTRDELVPFRNFGDHALP